MSETFQLDRLQAAMEEDFQQHVVNSMTPDRGYGFPTDHTRKIIDELEKENQRLKRVSEKLNDACITACGWIASQGGQEGRTFRLLKEAMAEFDNLTAKDGHFTKG